jgi:membrane protein YqaA with SNARE-associated domain
LPILLVSSWAYQLFQLVARTGPLGIFVLGILDASFLVLPFGNDLMLVSLIANHPQLGSVVLYVSMAVVGSVMGAFIDDLLSRRTGEKGLRKFASRKQIDKLKPRVERSAGWALFAAAVLPPPFPFTLIVMVSAALQYERLRLLAVVTVGRAIRFTVVGFLAMYFGSTLLRYANSRVVEYAVYAIVGISIIGSTIAIIRLVQSARR